MPKAMSHLFAAEKILNKNIIKIDNVSQYYLGSLSPDAEYSGNDPNRNHKNITHLYGNYKRENSDFFINNWKNNIKNFYHEHKSVGDHDFLLGYCLHIMCDVHYYKYTRSPFESVYGKEKDIIFQDESFMVDYEIFQKEYSDQKILSLLGKSVEFDFLDIISKDEMAKLKNDIANVIYKDRKPVNSGNNEYVTYEKTTNQNNEMIKFIINEFVKTL